MEETLTIEADVPDFHYDHQELGKRVVFTGEVRKIGASAFRSSGIKGKLEVVSSVKSIGAYAFWACYHLKTVVLPDGVDVGYEAFANCNSLFTVVMGSSGNFSGRVFAQLPRLYYLTMPVADASDAVARHTFEGCGHYHQPTTINFTGVADDRATLEHNWAELNLEFRSPTTVNGYFFDKDFVFGLGGDSSQNVFVHQFPCTVFLRELNGDEFPVKWDGWQSFRAAAAASNKALENPDDPRANPTHWNIMWGDEIVQDITGTMVKLGVREMMLVWVDAAPA